MSFVFRHQTKPGHAHNTQSFLFVKFQDIPALILSQLGMPDIAFGAQLAL
jgi:hypothetical protein